ncbi:MAG: hypothetical protein RQ862_10630 [Candidatus Caldarchaeales archaeon]|jgi:ABC-2 type transport system permease protein|nr:hypothetical protein [Candidatus Caldarchaeales archaeon]
MSGRGALAGRVMVEIERGLKGYARYRAWLVSDLVSWPFWTMFFFFSILMYSPDLLKSQYHLNALTWSFFSFILVSSFTWAANSLSTSIQEGILENVLVSGGSVRLHVTGRIVISLLDFAIGGPFLLLISAVSFGTNITVARPELMVPALIQAIAFLYLFSSVLSIMLIALRSPWIVLNVVQFAVPFTSGAIPVEVLPPDLRAALTYSPFFYIIHPIVASATGNFYLHPYQLFLTGFVVVLSLAVLGVWLEKALMRRALMRGRFSLF